MTLAKLCFLHYTNSMDEEKTLLKISLGILVLLIAAGALWRVLSYRPSSNGEIRAPLSQVQNAARPTHTAASKQNMVALLEEPASQQAVENVAHKGTVPSSYTVGSVTAVPYPKNRAPVKQTYPNNPSTGKRYVDVNFYDTDTKTPTYRPNSSFRYTTGYVGPQVNFNTSSSDSIQKERASKMLAPYLRPNQQDKARMDAQWNKMFAGLQRAVAKALMPKSKREEMIEKYAAKPAQTQTAQMPGFTGALSPVGEQVAAQKQLMMQQMGQAFGSTAAQQAGGIMDSFAGELAAALNAPNATAAQKEQQVKELTKKYQDKMDKLAEKNQYDKFMAQRTEEINQQKAEFRSQYGSELSDLLGKNLEEEWQEEQKLATQGLPQEDYYTQLAQLRQSKRDERQQLVIKNGQSINPMLEMEKKQAEAYLKDLQTKVENGEIESVARKATFNEIQNMQADVEEKRKGTLSKIKEDPLLGPQAEQEFAPILDDYQEKLNTIYQKELSAEERFNQEKELTKDVNRRLIDKQIEHVEKLDLPEVQKQKILEELRQAYNAI